MRSLVIACGRDRRWHDKHGAGERVWIWSIPRAASTANRFVYSVICQNVRHVLRIVGPPYCTLDQFLPFLSPQVLHPSRRRRLILPADPRLLRPSLPAQLLQRPPRKGVTGVLVTNCPLCWRL
ncbi:hypothetical protein J3E68DRAFT_412539 [Trichoderma sp. SZMC 28012]